MFWKCSDTVILPSFISTKPLFSQLSSVETENLWNNHHKKRREKKEKRSPGRHWGILSDTCHRYGSKPKGGFLLSDIWNLNTDQALHEDWLHYTRWVNIHSAAAFEVFSLFLSFQQYTKQLCVYVCVCLLAGYCFHVDINKRFKCWLCQPSLCFWSSIYLILSVRFKQTDRADGKSHHQSQLRTTTYCCINNLPHVSISISNKLRRLFLYLHRLRYFVAQKHLQGLNQHCFSVKLKLWIISWSKELNLNVASSACQRHKGAVSGLARLSCWENDSISHFFIWP